MDLRDKLKILSSSAKYDICSSSYCGKRTGKGGNVVFNGICHSFLPDGRCVSLFKVLLTNKCIGDCKYCGNNVNRRTQRVEFSVEEYTKLFLYFYEKNYVEGLFLSSGILHDADSTMEKILEIVENLRFKHNYWGYVHVKILPGVSYSLVKRATEIADRVSCNLEAPNKSRFSELSSTKDYKIDLLRRMRWVKKLRFPSQTTQFVVGASDEKDFEILKMVSHLQKNFGLKRSYFSAFEPVSGTPLENKKKTPLLREHRLYQAEFLMRLYKFRFEDLIFDDSENLPLNYDPKFFIALKNRDEYPIDVQHASYQELLKVPGIGPRSAKRIILLRRNGFKFSNFSELKNLGVVVRRAKAFLKVGNFYQGRLDSYGV